MNRYKEHIIKQAVDVVCNREDDYTTDFVGDVVKVLHHHGYRFSYSDVEQVVDKLENENMLCPSF